MGSSSPPPLDKPAVAANTKLCHGGGFLGKHGSCALQTGCTLAAMTGGETALCFLVAANGLHTGFQVTVTSVVYPALARTDPRDWAPAHDAHSRSIVGVVTVVYAMLIATTVWALVTNDTSLYVWLAALGGSLSVGATALVAGPLHGRLDANPDPELIEKLLVADQVRSVGAMIGFVASILAGLSHL